MGGIPTCNGKVKDADSNSEKNRVLYRIKQKMAVETFTAKAKDTILVCSSKFKRDNAKLKLQIMEAQAKAAEQEKLLSVFQRTRDMKERGW